MKAVARVALFAIAGLIVAATLISQLSAAPADWPNARNDPGNAGNSGETIPLPLVERWHSSAPQVEENGAVVSNGVVYMSTFDGQLYAFDVATGSVVSGFPVTTASNAGAPAVDAANQKVYALAGLSLFAFNLNGTTTWTASVGFVGYDFNVGPVVEAGFVYVKAGGNLYKYDSAGTQQWSVPTSGDNTQAAVSGSFVYVNAEFGQISKYDKATGAEVTIGGFPISTTGSQAGLAVAGGRIFHKADQLYAYDANTGATLWTAADGGDSFFYDSPAVAGGVVYVYGWDSKLYAFDEATGATMSGFPIADLATPSDRNWSSPTVAGDKVYVGAGTTQKLKVLGAAGTANAGVVLAEYPTFSADPQGFDLVSPVVSGGFVFAMLDGGGLYAFSAGEGGGPGSISINDGAACTESQNVTLTIDPGSNTEMRISEDPLFAGASFEPVVTSKPFTLSAGFGTKTVYIQFRDASGNLSNVFNDTIEYAASCATPTPTATPTAIEGPPGDSSCSDTIDNDGDTLVDLNDPDCQQPEICDNGVDDDGDTLVDAADPDCVAATEGPPGNASCFDGIDNDGDTLIDGADPDCIDPNAAVIPVPPATLTCTGVITFEDVTGGTAPGTNYDNVFQSDGASFAERFAGQVLADNAGFDDLSGSPSNPLVLQVGAPNQNLNVFIHTNGSQVLTGLGSLGYPDFNAIGEGSFAVLFDFDQSQFGFDLVGGNGGSATINFFRRDGSLVETVVVGGLFETSYGFMRVGGVNDIAGITIHDTDLGGIGFDNLCHDVPGLNEGPPGDPTCSDGIDNDSDTLVDTADPDCQSQQCPADDDDDFDDDGDDNEVDEDDDNDGEQDFEDSDDDNDGQVDPADGDDDNDGEGDDDDDLDNDGFATNLDVDDDNDANLDLTDPDDDNDGEGDETDGDDDNDGEADEVDDEDGDDDDDPADDCDLDDDNDGEDDSTDNCPTIANSTQADDDGDGNGDDCDDGDGDGFVDASELQIGTSTSARCGSSGLPLDLVSGGFQPNTLNVVDLASFVAPVRRIGTDSGDAGYDSRWDLLPGSSFGVAINIQDLASMIAGPTAYPPMLDGQRAFGRTCP